MSHAHTTHPFHPAARPRTADGIFARLVRAWRFAVEVVTEARAMEARYRREHRSPYHGW